jgi:hypothetical protein
MTALQEGFLEGLHVSRRYSICALLYSPDKAHPPPGSQVLCCQNSLLTFMTRQAQGRHWKCFSLPVNPTLILAQEACLRSQEQVL